MESVYSDQNCMIDVEYVEDRDSGDRHLVVTVRPNHDGLLFPVAELRVSEKTLQLHNQQ